MPNWKKVVTSGSKAVLQTLEVNPQPSSATTTHGANLQIMSSGSGTQYGLLISGSTFNGIPLALIQTSGSGTTGQGEFIYGKGKNGEDSFRIRQAAGGAGTFALFCSESTDRQFITHQFSDPTQGAVSYVNYSEDSRSNAYFGIGVNNPTSHLHVSGNAILTGDIQIGTGTVAISGSAGTISASGFVSASSFSGDGSGLTNVSATVADESITLAKLAHAAANTVLVRDANSTGDPSFKAVTNTQILIGDGTGFTAAALSGDVTMTNAGAVTIAANAVEGSMLNSNVAGTGLTVAGNNIDVDAAQTQITSVGTLTGLTVDGQITASGNISASGTIISNDITADAVTGVDSILNTGLKVGRDSTDLIDFGATDNEITYRINNDLRFVMAETVFRPSGDKQAGLGVPAKQWSHLAVQHITASGNISASGEVIGATATLGGFTMGAADGTIARNLTLGSSLVHDGDADTKIAFTTDTITMTAGNVEMLKLSEGGLGNVVVINEGSTDSNVRVESNNDTNMLFVDGGNDKLGIRAGANPSKTLTVGGDISASGGFFVSSSGNVMINSDLTGSMATHLGAFSVNYGNHTQLTGSLAVNGDGYGDIVKIGGTTTVKGQMYYLDTDSTWTLSNATDDSAGADKLLAIALGTNSDIDGMLLKGFTKLNVQGTTVVGAPIYMNTSNGNTTFVANDTAAEIVRIVGYCLTGGEEMYFNPDSTFVEVA